MIAGKIDAAFATAALTNTLIYCGDEGCSLEEAITDIGGDAEHVGSEGDYEMVRDGGRDLALWSDGNVWVAVDLNAGLSVTNKDIEDLRTEAAAAGDTRQVEFCDLALDGDDHAWYRCYQIISEARNQ